MSTAQYRMPPGALAPRVPGVGAACAGPAWADGVQRYCLSCPSPAPSGSALPRAAPSWSEQPRASCLTVLQLIPGL